ncbi:hypothetical protein C8Q80DRAFT_1275827 [Daedaleopsis nitida]|nr:hypothetical protein C8Q80DRAFT_1275827 [Daedaleopsis nitida]
MPSKRTLNDSKLMDSPSIVAPARGRKRFLYDLQRASQTVEQGVEVQGLRLLSVAPGDEDGSFNCVIVPNDGEFVATLTILVSDASEYPSDHSFFCSAQDEIPAYVSRVIESIYEDGSLSIQDLLLRLLAKVAKSAMGKQRAHRDASSDEEDADDEDDADDYGIDEDLDILGAAPGVSKVDRAIIQRHFNEIVGYEYCPGYIPFGVDDFALSVSVPVMSLAEMIPARALMAWDKRLLTRTQYFTLLISGARGVYPIVQPDGTLTQTAHFHGTALQFRVGLTSGYKPTQEEAADTIRKYGLKEEYEARPVEQAEIPAYVDDPYLDGDDQEPPDEEPAIVDQTQEETTTGFRPFSLSSSLESLLNGHFLRLLQLRLQYGLGWAGAEVLLWESETTQQPDRDIMRLRGDEVRSVDLADQHSTRTYLLSEDPLRERSTTEPVNLPLLAFSYLLRRLTLCPRYCLVCHQQLKEDLDALKPYVCSSKLCTYQYYTYNRGPSLEYEICVNPDVVDLLVSLAYIAAAEGALDAPLPMGMGLRVPCKTAPADDQGLNRLYDFDTLDLPQMRMSITQLIDFLPAIADMKKHLEQPSKAGRMKPRLQDMDKSIPEAAWAILRWCVASATAHLEELKDEDEQVKNIGSEWRQFRFSVGAPDAEARFRKSVMEARRVSARINEYPSLYAWHGSPAKNWHSIIRHGLWCKTIAHGRAYGDGVYFAKEGSYSTGTYSRGAQSCWRNSAARVQSCVALAEIVNLPSRFVSSNPFFVVKQTEWIICRYLLIKGSWTSQLDGSAVPGRVLPLPVEEDPVDDSIPYVPLDPLHPLTLTNKRIRIPEPTHTLEKIVAARREEFPAPPAADLPRADAIMIDFDDWTHDRVWVERAVEHLIPPPTESSPRASTSLLREYKAMVREQETAKSLRDLGWHMPLDFNGDNLYQWIVELHSFDESLPIAQDMKRCGVNSLVFEIRFPADFPHAPPFFRILRPRLLPFSQGGGGHVTLGGSMCMDLLTADGWLPSYSISAILLQIKLAISNLDPRPARLAQAWDMPYGMQEALEGYKRAANVHGWKIPRNVDKIAY